MMWVHLVCNWECRRKLRHPRKSTMAEWKYGGHIR